MPRLTRLPREFYARDTEWVARELLGKLLVRRARGGREWIGRVVETEAYHGFDDRASHAHRGKTARNQIMFGPPGFAYVYQIYGMHFCLNAVTGVEGVPSAVLVRAIAPVIGRAWPRRHDDVRAGAGPAKLCDLFEIDKRQYGEDLVTGGSLWFADDGARIPDAQVGVGPRVNVDYAGDWAARPWRFWIDGDRSVSRSPRKRGRG